jgi:hypothetical protein
MKNLLFNPFEKYAGKEALISGIALAACAALLSSLFNTRFDGVLDIHFVAVDTSVKTALLDQLINLASLIVIFYILALAFGAKSTRLVDVAGTLALARAPFILAPFLNSTGFMSAFSSKFEYITPGSMPEITASDILPLIPVILVLIVLSIWMIALSFNAWKVSTNLKGIKLIVSFIIGVLASEILSKTILTLT